MDDTNTVYLSLGSNLGDKLSMLQEAIYRIDKQVGKISAVSPVYQSAAWGFESDDFFNICLAVSSKLTAPRLLKQLMDIESSLGRSRTDGKGYSARCIDIDILYYNRMILNSEQLTLPHPSLQDRRFVLRPLSDIAPQFYHPILKKDSRNLLQECKDEIIPKKTNLVLFKNRTELFSQLQFLAIEGNIGAGKTTLAKRIAKDFNAKLILERFADNPFLPKFYEDQSRYAFPLEMSFLADRYQQFIDDTTQLDLFKKFMVSDYDIYKSLIFAKITLQEVEFSLYRKIFDFMYREVKKPDVYVFLYQNTDRLLDNIKKRGRDYEQEISFEYLDKINRGYLDYIKSQPSQNSLIIDVTDLDFVENEKDYETVMNQIQQYVMNWSF
ncbi:2-amino-4-hydroxy-6-hydroxymethyldihydropteridine diphosphokinase [Aurantibacter crassamenti]|uniref:2-amino-4-hydroxy-6- hydroxymethyldihydropteridine diphosphokinase n=1 Tax=Aurantibacter crassamenti TaxID=1837375 RepID=UPI00193A98D8|nr:2-amino-4-hydroxy-6-hydroxymethyldihydropteridine diphosphokinase [Aurantibacter crassamenti]MBM1106050.1 2-amino-4-hydroxy-6-hydroxymethyldihydropteridine diphosphokinase [Aurantibacter crassamenti]